MPMTVTLPIYSLHLLRGVIIDVSLEASGIYVYIKTYFCENLRQTLANYQIKYHLYKID